MKKRSLVVLFLILTLVFAFTTTSVAFAEDESSDILSKDDLVYLIVCYVIFGLSIIIAIPAIRAVNKRKKYGYITDLCEATEGIVKEVKILYDERDKKRTRRDAMKFSLKLTTIGDMALTTYTEKQIAGYYDIYNDLATLKNNIAGIQKHIGEESYNEEFLGIIKLAESINERAKILKDNEEIIEKYNK